MKVCLECGGIFNRFSELKEGIICPTLFCSGKVTEIDDAILHTILLLNQKGYSTTHCCSGHTWGGYPFIEFDEIVHLEEFSSIPKDFSSSVSDGKLRLSKSISEGNTIKRQRELMKASVDLISWADKLRPAQFMEAHFFIPCFINEDGFIKEVGRLLHLHFVESDSLRDLGKDQIRICFDKLIDPIGFKKLTKVIEDFAAIKGVYVYTENCE